MKYTFVFKPTTYFLTEKVGKGEKILHTTAGNFRVRKNGKVILILANGTEFIRVTPISS